MVLAVNDRPGAVSAINFLVHDAKDPFVSGTQVITRDRFERISRFESNQSRHGRSRSRFHFVCLFRLAESCRPYPSQGRRLRRNIAVPMGCAQMQGLFVEIGLIGSAEKVDNIYEDAASYLLARRSLLARLAGLSH